MSARASSIIVFASLMLLTGTAAEAAARLPAPINLEVDGGEGWHPVNRFRLDWRNPTVLSGPSIAAAHYLIRDPQGGAIGGARIGWAANRIENLRIPGPPGAYTLEVWLEDAFGIHGDHATASLRFDDVRPANTEPRQLAGWIGEADLPHLVHVERPAGPLPVSGIRGYAVSIDRSPEGDPCADPTLCSDAETDLRGGIDDDALAVAELPEGMSYAHAVAVSGSGMRSADVGTSVLRVDRTYPVTQLIGVTGGWTNRSIDVIVTAADAASGLSAGDGAFTAIRIDGGAPKISGGDAVRATVIADGVHRISHYARDAAGNISDGATRNGVQNPPPATTTVRIDRDPPTVAFLGSQDPLDPELITARVTDLLAGPNAARGWIGVRPAGSGDRFEPLPTAAVPTGLRTRWDSEAYPPGRYEFRATGYDAAGNVAVGTRRADGSGMVLANPLKTPTALNLGFGGSTLVWHRCSRRGGKRSCRRETVSGFERRPRSRVFPYGRGTLLSGRLLTAAGAPLEGAPVRVLERIGGESASTERIATVRTESGGRFSVRLAPGPSREIIASFDGTRTLTRSTARTLRLGVRSAVRLRVSSTRARVGGRPVVFSGRVIDPVTIPPEGKTVALQFRLPDLPWTEFRTIKTDRRGRFRYPYRFSDDDSRGIRFQFRAYATAQGGWPYEPGASSPVVVTGL